MSGELAIKIIVLVSLFSFLTFSSQADQSIVLSNVREQYPELFFDVLEKQIKGNYEAEHPTDLSRIEDSLNQCNPKKSLKMPRTFRGGFTVCVELFVFDLWGGIGNFSIESTDNMGRSLTLSGTSPFVGGQIIFPYTLGSNVIMEGKYWYLPSFAAGGSAFEDLRTSSMVEGILVYQKRVPFSPWSLRLGGLGLKLPLAKDWSSSSLMSQSEINIRNGLLGGPLVGLKLALNRENRIKHLFYGDLALLVYSDNRFTLGVLDSYAARLGAKWFFARSWALTVDGEFMRYKTKYDEKSQTAVAGIGMQTFLF